jgi:sugar phosphate isomerase/epimerase
VNLSIVLSTHAAEFEAVPLAGDFESSVARVAGWGYDGVELAIRDPVLLDPEDLERIVSSQGLLVPAVGTGQAWGEEGLSLTSADPSVRAAAIERLENHVPLAARLEATIILGLIRGVTPEGQTHERSMTYLVEAGFALEPLNRYETDLVHTVAEGLDLIERVGAANFGLLLDTFHMNIEEAVIEESIRMCGDRIFHFHVADSNRWPPGAGHLDFASILKSLSATGYEGFVSGEFLPLPNPDIAAAQTISFLRSL